MLKLVSVFSGSGKNYYSSRHRAVASYSDAKLLSKFMKHVKENDMKMVHKIIKKGFNVNDLFRFEGEMEKMTAIHYAAKEGMVAMVKELLTSNCDVNIITAFDLASPLHFSCQLSDNDAALAIAEDLIHMGADVNSLDHAEKTALGGKILLRSRATLIGSI